MKKNDYTDNVIELGSNYKKSFILLFNRKMIFYEKFLKIADRSEIKEAIESYDEYCSKTPRDDQITFEQFVSNICEARMNEDR